MRKVRLLLVVCLCLVLTAPVLAVEGEREERSGWAGVVEWVWNKLYLAVKGPGLEPGGLGKGPSIEPNGLDQNEQEKGPELEPNG